MDAGDRSMISSNDYNPTNKTRGNLNVSIYQTHQSQLSTELWLDVIEFRIIKFSPFFITSLSKAS